MNFSLSFKRRKQSLNLDLLNDPIKGLIHKMSAPLMLSGFVSSSYGFIDMIFASRLGSVEVAAIAFITPLFVLLQAFTTGITRGGVSIIAKLIGNDQRAEASAYASQLRWLMLLLSAFVTLSFVFLLPLLLRFSNVPEALSQQSQLYASVMFLSMPFVLFSRLYNSFFRTQGKVKVLYRIAIFSIFTNAIFNYLFLTFTSLNIQGLAFANVISGMLSLTILLYIYTRSEQSFDLSWRKDENFSTLALWKKLLKVGLPLSISQASSHFGFLLLNILIVQFGHHAVAAFAIGNRINSLMFASCKQIGSAMVPLLAQNLGKGAIERVKEGIHFSLLYSLIIGVIAALILYFIKYPIALYLTKDDTITYNHIINYVGLVGWTVIAWVILHTFQATFTAFQKTVFSMTIDIVRLWGIRIPGVLLFLYLIPTVAEYGIWYTMFISNIVALIFAIVYFIKLIPPLLCDLEKE